MNILMGMGLVFNGDCFVYPHYGYGGINYHWTELQCDADDRFEAVVLGIKARIGRGPLR